MLRYSFTLQIQLDSLQHLHTYRDASVLVFFFFGKNVRWFGNYFPGRLLASF